MKKFKIPKVVEKILIGLSAIVVSIISVLVAKKIKASRKVKGLIIGLTTLVSSLTALLFILKRNKKGDEK